MIEEVAYAVHSLLKYSQQFFVVVFLTLLFFVGGGGGGGGGQAIVCIKLGTSLYMELHTIFNP